MRVEYDWNSHRLNTFPAIPARGRWVFCLVVLSMVGSSALAVEVPPAEIENRRCLSMCHGQSRISQLSVGERLQMVSSATSPAATRPAGPPTPSVRPELYVASDALAGSVHAALACVDCHQDAKSLPHPRRLAPAACGATCHTEEGMNYRQGTHAEAVAKGDARAPTCATCHGGHDILPKHQRQARTHPLNIVKICGDCHQMHQGANGLDGPQHLKKYLESVHGRLVTRGGLAVAATCADCHSEHMVLPSRDPRSTVNRNKVADTCGQCHVGLSETYQASVHGQELAKGNPKAPVCSDCHTSHSITRTDTPSFKLDIVSECGECHDKPVPGSTRKSSLYETYRLSYHGQVTALGSQRGARCSNCHGAHDIRRNTDPLSRLYGDNRVQTCRQDTCHPNATVQFAKFEPHADYRDARRFPLLHGVWLYFVIMMSFAFGFFGLHSLLWLIRSVIERLRHGPAPKPDAVAASHAIKRFNRVDRMNHGFVILSFFGLTLTGLPLLYSDKEWGKTLAGMLGGVSGAGNLHRFFAVMLIGNFVVHFVGVIRRFRRYGVRNLLFGPTTMLPRWKDVTDCIGMFRWFFKGGKKPAFDRWTYWEKFDYVAEVGGSGIIGLTGILLWFARSSAFSSLPGWIYNVAALIHGYEALLAIGFIFTIHFFNAHLRLEKFPVDEVIFTGRLTEEEFKHERPAEYERVAATGELETLRVKPPHRAYRIFAVIVGVVAMAIGTTLVALIVLAGLGHL